MKKTLLYSFAAFAAVMLASCNGDYDDWAAPQHNDPENAVKIPGFQATAVGETVNLAGAQENVKLFSLSEAALPEGTTLEKTRVKLDAADKDIAKTKEAIELSATNDGMVETAELQNAVVSAYGKAPYSREFDMHVYSDVMADGQAMLVDAGTVKVNVIPQAPNIEKTYYLVGSLDSWSLTKKDEYKLTNGGGDQYADPVFSVTVPSPGDVKVEFKVVPESGFGADGKVAVWDNALSAAADGTEGEFSYSNEAGNITFQAEASVKKYKIEFNMLEGTYTVTGMNDPELYMTGSNYGWGTTWKPLVRVFGSDTDFWTMIYLHSGEQFKFSPDAGWEGKDFGAEAELQDEAGAGVSAEGTNIKVENAGWYLLHITNDTKRIVRFLKAEVYLQGDAIGNWNLEPQNKFTAPTDENGMFVSPAFVKDANVRMCVVIDKANWWKSEFNVFSGKIVFRGNGGDQDAVPVKAGQKAYLDFNKGTGELK